MLSHLLYIPKEITIIHKRSHLNASSFKPNKTNSGCVKYLTVCWRVDCWLYAQRFFILHAKKLWNKTWNKIEYMMNESEWQSYDKKSLSDKNQVPLWIKRMISLWTAMEINLAMFTVYKWQSIKLLWSKCKFNFWDFSIFTMTSKTAHYKI